MRVSRSVLAVPASSTKMVEKGLSSGADLLFLDLEDAVAPGSKAEARKNVIQAVNERDWRGRPTMYRMNALDTPYFYRDVIEVAEEAGESLDLILVPKVELPEDLVTLDTLLRGVEAASGLEPGKVKLEAQIETALGLVNIDAIARATDRLEALHFGPGDYAASVRMPQTSIGTADEWDDLYPGHRFHYVMHRIVVAARAAGLRAVDGPVADFRDEEGLRRSCLLSRSIGFDGKWCIHPGQIEAVNELFSPTEEEVEWAKKVVGAYEEAEAAGSGSINMDGKMVDAASIRMARNTLDLVRASETRPNG
ncbi:MAG: Similar to citrate lyase beta chain, 2 [uncultured Rubrobacteraceae bacterium]|uniref:Similar to citrate lyase beta chain, 2 n=1 Tax=uncultured Rubrobacteraceae bacterium TaxID=349277 RepID=A0A6J4QZD6_9ACTN|nr:MAG: Similar to citrate lyase beta chain, 2 [uncultured Rubrobacteraceae bacterium]